jgi:glycosyltransferase involved in cell wall biosynthesis
MAVTLCLNMIVRNEERIIARCLNSVAAHVGCWIIGDTGSTDRTPAIVQDFFRDRDIPGELHHFPFLNFEQARNEALDRARSSALAFDYVLLTDADMELAVTDASFRDRLTAPAYSVLQRTRISYWNDRLVRRDTVARYRGVTHEYLEVPAGRERLEGIHFIDHAEGSSRAEKFARDIRLLREDLARDPENVRSWFYLAQSFRDNGQWDEAIKAYQRRVELGGWAEESWYARLQIARCLLRQGDEAGFLQHALAAWNDRPHRAEPLYDLAKYHRDRSLNAPATLFAATGLQIGRPKDDTLFIEDWIYDWGLREEYSISGYYVAEHRARAAAVCDSLALSANTPAAMREQARRNLRFYAGKLNEKLRSFETFRVDFTPEPPYRAMNPSVVRWNNQLWMVQRTVNYTLTEAGDYVTADGGPVRTRNYLLTLDPSFGVRHAAELPLPEDLPPPSFGEVLGFEDLRPFIWNGELWATATVREQNPAGWCETFLCRIDQPGSAAPRLVDRRVLRPDGKRRHEKNWIAASSGQEVRFIYSIAPTRILDSAARVLSNKRAPWAAGHVRGGSQAIPFGPGWLAVCHEHVGVGKARYYLHRFVWLDRTGSLRRISAPFNLVRPGVEFVTGLAWHPDGKRLVISFGVGDGESWIGCFPAADLPPILMTPTPTTEASGAAAKVPAPRAGSRPSTMNRPEAPGVTASSPRNASMSGNVTYWRQRDPIQNMGDYLSELFVLRVAAAPLVRYSRIRLIGSVLSNFIIEQDLAAGAAQPGALVGYWGCGLRDEDPVRTDLRARCRFHGVRGPLTRDLLGLPADTPLGDPALLLPLLHTPRPAPTLAGRTICVPHINDDTSDRPLLAGTGADVVVRAAVPRSIEALLETIDAIAAAEFVLAGALHAAIIACAYQRPFAYYDSGNIDLPFKWRDFSASVDIPTVFVCSVTEGLRIWDTQIAPALRRPRLEPILAAFPGEARPGLLARAKAWDESSAEHGGCTVVPDPSGSGGA